MRTILQFIVLIVGGLLVISGCSSSQVENTSSPTAIPQQDTASNAETHQQTSSKADSFVFYDSFASWWTSCKRNIPTVSGLEETFAEQVEFVMLDWDDKSLDDIRQQVGITGRTQYALVDPDGNILKQWYGILNEEAVEDEITTLIKG